MNFQRERKMLDRAAVRLFFTKEQRSADSAERQSGNVVDLGELTKVNKSRARMAINGEFIRFKDPD